MSEDPIAAAARAVVPDYGTFELHNSLSYPADGSSYLPIREIERLRAIELAVRAFLTGWDGPDPADIDRDLIYPLRVALRDSQPR